MTRRMLIGVGAGVVASLAAGVGAVAVGAHGGVGRPAFVRRMVTAALDDALDAAKVTANQRAVIYGGRDRVFAELDAHRQGRGAHLDAALRLFEADQVDPAEVEALHRQVETERQQIRDTVHQALIEAHDVLTPAQRKAVTDYVRAHRLSHIH